MKWDVILTRVDAVKSRGTSLQKRLRGLRHRLTLLLKLASGESAPLGPAADRAKAEALKLVRHADTRAELSGAPDQVEAVRDLIQQAGLAA